MELPRILPKDDIIHFNYNNNNDIIYNNSNNDCIHMSNNFVLDTARRVLVVRLAIVIMIAATTCSIDSIPTPRIAKFDWNKSGISLYDKRSKILCHCLLRDH
jgi:hypothetical protein